MAKTTILHLNNTGNYGREMNATRAAVMAFMEQANNASGHNPEFAKTTEWFVNTLAALTYTYAIHCSQSALDKEEAARDLVNIILEETRARVARAKHGGAVGTA